MTILFVQTWTVSKGKYEELVKKFNPLIESKFGQKSRYYQQRYGPIGARVGIMEFKDDDEFHSFMDEFNNDEKALNYRSKWHELIDTASWRAVFWDETARE